MSDLQNMWHQFRGHISKEQYEEAMLLLLVIEKYRDLE